MSNAIIISIVVILVVLSALYIYKAKKRGAKCIGCPISGKCKGNCGGQNN